MANIRSNLPSRLRQLLSSEGAIGPSIKLDSESPPQIKAFIEKVKQCPLPDIAIPLSGFCWEYGKGNFHHWKPLFLQFDTYFKTYLSSRNELLLSNDILCNISPFPKEAVVQILRVMQLILENCHNKSSFVGLEHFKLLLASTDPEILIAALETLWALVKITPSKLHTSGKLVGCGSVNSYLLSLAQGWGSKEEGLGLYSCVTLHERTQDDVLCLFPPEVQNDCGKLQYRIGSTLYFELHGIPSPTIVDASSTVSFGMSLIHLPDLHLREEDDLSLMKFCIDKYNVPLELRFSLLTRIRYARAFRSSRICRLYSKICLLAFIVLVQSSDSHNELVSFFANEPEYTNELIRIVRSEETISGTIRTLAMTALAAQLAAYSASHERARILSGSSISFAGGNRMILLSVLQRAILSLNNSSDLSSVTFVEALLQFYLLHVISSSSTGSVVRGSGMVPTFLPLLEDSDPTHLHLVCLAVKTLQKLMDYSNTAVTLFRDLGGVELLVHRLQIEVHRVIDFFGTKDDSMAIDEFSRYNNDQFYVQKRLIRALLKALGSATYATTNAARSQNSYDVSLTPTLSVIFSNKEKFGGEIYSAAVTLMSEMIHKDPTCFGVLFDLGLPTTFLSSVVAGSIPSSKAITCIPNGLGAICLNPMGLESVRETSALRFLFDIFTDRKYVMAMNEGIVPLSNAVEELLRHVSSLRGCGVDIIIEIMNKIASLEDTECSMSSGKVEGSDAMEMDLVETKDKENLGGGSLVDAADLSVKNISNKQCTQLFIFHVMVLVHRMLENSETCRLFVEKKGIEALLKLLLRPSMTQSSEGMSIALNSTMVLKCFTQHHSTPLARAICSSLRDHLKKTLTGLSVVSGSFMLDPRASPDTEVFSSLSLVEFLLFLVASKDNRWITALLTEFGNDNKDVLEDIGRIHREVLWQIALLEDTKVEIEDNSTGNVVASRQSESSMSDTEDPRSNSFRQFLDPLLRRRTSGLSFESQFFDLINLYRDLTRSSGILQRQIVDAPLNSQIGTSVDSHPSGASDESESIAKKDDDTQKSLYNSCCDMVRSLSLHITHLFQELGKIMLLPSRRRDEILNVSPASKSVASTFASIALDHMNFGGHLNSYGSESSVSTKCRYFGKVTEFIDGIILEKPDSCNPVVLNCLYGRGVIHSILTTFQATSQLPFAISGAPASPMDTDDGRHNETEDNHLWIYKPSASYGKLMEHLVNSSFILSPFTKHLLVQPLISGDIPFPKDAETFVKILQSMVLKAVLPVWTHPRFPECSFEFIARIVNIFRHVFSGVEVKNVSSDVARVAGTPPNESAIQTIVEMGFSRSRAEDALRQVGTNSVELAMEWLFSHPEETQEEDELARALAMSLGNSGDDPKEDVIAENVETIEEELMQPPPVDELLLVCRKLLQMKENVAFPVRDLLMMICSQNESQERPKIMSFIIEQVKLCGKISDPGNQNMLSAFLHLLALILNEDVAARELASKSGFVKVASDLLLQWISGSNDQESSQVPKWLTSAFVAIDRLAQVDTTLDAEVVEFLKKNDVGNKTSIIIDEDNKQNKGQLNPGTLSKYLDLQEQTRLIEIACGCIKKQMPSETTHAVLQLCSTLTRTHSIAVTFMEAGGLQLLLSLPESSLFTGFDNVAAIIIRHILEDSHTLQQAMESEIRHAVTTAANRQSSGRLNPRNFLSSLSSVAQRDPVIFMQAAKSVCQVEMVGDRPYIVLIKDRDKEKSKEKEKEKDKTEEKEKQQSGKGRTGDTITPGSGHGKHDANFKNSKIHKKPPQSFVNVIDLLLDSIIFFVPPPLDGESKTKIGTSTTDMEIDVFVSKGKGKAFASVSEENEVKRQESSFSMVKVVFLLKLLTEILLMYASSVHVLVRKDAEVCNSRALPQRSSAACCIGGIFHHVLYKFLPYSKSHRKEKKTEVDWHLKLASRANQFLVASCVRSSEARKRIFTEISNVFNDYVNSSNGFSSPKVEIQSLVDLLNDVLAARSPTGSSISAEASVTFIEVGLVQSLTRTLHVLDLDHADSPKIVTVILKVLELVTKEHVHASESNSGKGERSIKSTDNSQPGEDNISTVVQTISTPTPAVENVMAADRVESFSTTQNYGDSENVNDDMDHDQDIDGVFAAAENDYMQENSEDTRTLEDGLIRFEIRPGVQGNLDEDEDDEDDADDDEDDMSGDEGDEDDDADDGEHNDIEEDEAHDLPHPDTDQDDHEIDEDEFDEEVMEEDEDEDEEEDDEDGVIVRLGEGMDGVNVFDHIEVFERDSISSETFHVMPVEIFGSRRPGRTTSIYNLLGRNGDSSGPSQHPLLVEPPLLHAGVSRLSDNDRSPFSVRSSEGSLSQLDSVFRSLRNGRQGNRLNMLWGNESQLSGVSNPSVIAQGFEDLLVSSLRLPSDVSSQNTTLTESQNNNEVSPSSEFADMRGTETLAENQDTVGGSYATHPSSEINSSRRDDSADATNVSIQGTQSTIPQHVETQYDHTDVVRDVEAVSQESSESGATLGESLRSLDVEIGSADGHDDGGGDNRTRRVNPSFVNNTIIAGRDTSLRSVAEVSEDSTREADQGGPPEEQNNNADPIDPAFLDALPEELRAEVLSAPQSEAQQPQNPEPQTNEDIDPEFLAALPPDIREEVLAQQRAQRIHQSQELEGQPVEMDTVSIIATFPSDIREEVLLTSSDAVLANLTPALVAEANMLRERFAHRYNQTMFGMQSRNRRGESSRRGDALERVGGVLSRRSMGIKPVEADGSPLVDSEGLKALIRLLRVVQPLYKSEQRLLLNLCAHAEARTGLLKIMMDLLMLDKRKSPDDLNALEPPYRLYGCQTNVTYSRPEHVDGVPPLVSRRVLETLTYLSRNHPLVAKLLLEFRFPRPSFEQSPISNDKRGKAVMVIDEDMLENTNYPDGQESFTLLLSLLNQSLYLRSIAHLEQLLNLLDVIIDNVERKPNSPDDPKASASEQPSDPQISTSDTDMNVVSAGKSVEVDVTASASSSGAEKESDAQRVMKNLPKLELQLLCSLLACEGLSDNAYALVAEILRKLVAIAPLHCHLFIAELADSVQSLTKSAAEELRSFGVAEKSLVSTPAMHGAPVLRVLQTLSSLVVVLDEKDKKPEILPDKEHSAAISLVWNIITGLEPLWQELSNCISQIESYSDMVSDPSPSSVKLSSSVTPLPAGSQNVLPYVESFFVMCEKLHASVSGSAHDFGVNTVSDVDGATTSAAQHKTSGFAVKVDEKFAKFSEKHRKLLNAFIRQNPGLLEKSFSLMLKVPRFIDFDNKRSHFRSKIKQQHDHHHSPLRISVRRAYILEDSYNQLRMRSAQDLKGRLTVNFQGEEGIDAGGLTREWYQLLSRVIFDKGALLFTTVGNESTFQPNPNSVYQTEHLSYFKFVGRVVGKALFDGQLLDVHFTRSFYKHILGVKVTYHDIEAIDPDYFKNLKWLLENDISDILDLTFSIDADEEKLILYERAAVTDYELIPGGRNIRVTEENKHQYVDLVAEHRLTTAIRPQINAFMEGFNELISRDLISIFNDKELELLISGLPDIDLEDLRANTEYYGYSAASPAVQWFWEVVQAFSKEDKARLLQFVTGTSKVPLEGFSALQGISGSQKFQIHKAYGSADHLPSAHTCFNQLDLPEYPSKPRLEERLLLAIHEGSEGFGFG